jgi:hypothetical protein
MPNIRQSEPGDRGRDHGLKVRKRPERRVHFRYAMTIPDGDGQRPPFRALGFAGFRGALFVEPKLVNYCWIICLCSGAVVDTPDPLTVAHPAIPDPPAHPHQF